MFFATNFEPKPNYLLILYFLPLSICVPNILNILLENLFFCHQIKTIMRFLLYIICHDDVSENKAKEKFLRYSWARIYRIPSTIYFENALFSKLAHEDHSPEWAELDYVGQLQYRHYERQVEGGIVDPDGQATQLAFSSCQKDIIAFGATLFTGYGHKGLRSVCNQLFPTLRILRGEKEPTFFFNNAWMARPPLYLAYLAEFNKLVGQWDDPLLDIYHFVRRDSGYFKNRMPAGLVVHSGLLPTVPVAPEAKETKAPTVDCYYYPWIPFVLERLPALFFHGRKNSVFHANLADVPNFLPKTIFLGRQDVSGYLQNNGTLTGRSDDRLSVKKIILKWIRKQVHPQTKRTHQVPVQWFTWQQLKAFCYLLHIHVVKTKEDFTSVLLQQQQQVQQLTNRKEREHQLINIGSSSADIFAEFIRGAHKNVVFFHFI